MLKIGFRGLLLSMPVTKQRKWLLSFLFCCFLSFSFRFLFFLALRSSVLLSRAPFSSSCPHLSYVSSLILGVPLRAPTIFGRPGRFSLALGVSLVLWPFFYPAAPVGRDSLALSMITYKDSGSRAGGSFSRLALIATT